MFIEWIGYVTTHLMVISLFKAMLTVQVGLNLMILCLRLLRAGVTGVWRYIQLTLLF